MPDDYHRPVLADEVVALVVPVMPGLVVDATVGGGGHARRLLERLGEDLRLLGIDRDPDALAATAELDIPTVQGNFAHLRELVTSHTNQAPACVLFDFGISAHQVESPERGFSYRLDGPLDMRMGPDAPITAWDVVNTWEEKDLARVIGELGEEPLNRRIARVIVAARPLDTTLQLSTVIADAMPAARRRAGHPARRTFQAIRIAVNGELDAVAAGLDQALELVRPGGRVIAISYHSLEDRIVKRRFAEGSRGCTCPPEMPECGCGNTAELRLLTRKPVRPSAAEVESNIRARSAVLRAAERLAA